MCRIAPLVAISVGVCLTSVGGCKPKPTPTGATSAAPSHSRAPVPMASAVPIPAQSVSASVNPRNLPPYAGPAGSLEGVVRIKGDPPPKVALPLPTKCLGAESMYGTRFREGPGRTVADVLVAVTEYEGYVPSQGPSVSVSVNHCAFDRKTVVLTYGQRIEVENQDKNNSYIPYLIGNSTVAHMVVVPGGDPVKLYPLRVGQYALADEMNRRWMKADVFVFKYATHAVTGIDGRYKIDRIPEGEVKVNALLVSIDKTVEHKVKIKANETTTLDIELEYTAPVPSASASSSTKKPVPKIPLIR